MGAAKPGSMGEIFVQEFVESAGLTVEQVSQDAGVSTAAVWAWLRGDQRLASNVATPFFARLGLDEAEWNLPAMGSPVPDE